MEPVAFMMHAPKNYCEAKWWARLEEQDHDRFQDIPFTDDFWKVAVREEDLSVKDQAIDGGQGSN